MAFTDLMGGTLIYPSQLSYLPLTISSDVQLDWPLEQNPGGGDIVADIIDVNAVAPGLTVQFSDASQIGTGYSALFVNVGANTFSVLDNEGNTLVSIASGQAWQLYLRNNTTPQGVWGVFQFGAGVSVANAGALAGAGLQAINTTLNECIPINAQSAPYTIQTGDQASVVEWTGGTGAIEGPVAGVGTGQVGSTWFCILKNSGSGGVTFTPGSGTIDGQANKFFDLNQSAWIVCDGTNFFTLGYGQSITSLFNFIQISLTGESGNYVLSGAQLNAISYRFTGVMAGDTVVIVPGTIQQYWMDNETTGGNLSFGTAAQVDPPSLPTTQRNIFYCDSTNVYAAVTAGISLPIGPTQGGTGQTTWTLGDTLYSNGANTLAKLAGSIVATKRFLVQTGTGSISAAPLWGTIAMADLAASPTGIKFLRGNGTWTQIGAADLGGGTANNQVVLRGDQAWSRQIEELGYGAGGVFANLTTSSSGVFSPAANGFNPAFSPAISWSRDGNHITLMCEASQGTSNAATFNFDIPNSLIPHQDQYIACDGLVDNGQLCMGSALVRSTGFLQLNLAAPAGGTRVQSNSNSWTPTGFKGFQFWSVTYSLGY